MITGPDGRIASLDAARGLAVLGILAVNAISFAMPAAVYPAPHLSPFPLEGASALGWAAMHVGFERKFVALFSLLFGVSLYLVGGERRDPAREPVLRRRLGWLALFGLIHGAAFWYGDILLLYALCGFVAMNARSWSGRRLLIVGAGAWFGLGLAYAGLMTALAFAPPEVRAEAAAGIAVGGAEGVQASIAAYRQGAWGSTWSNLLAWAVMQPSALIGFGPSTVGLMLAGLGLYKLRFWTGGWPAWAYLALMALAALLLAGAALHARAMLEQGFPFPAYMNRWVNDLFAPVIALGYASALILLLGRGGAPWLWPLRAAGRMAFTNYLTQTLIMTTVFYAGRGLGWFGLLDWPALWALVAGVWAVQLVWSPLWLARFRYGPFEWLWRSLTLGRRVALRRYRVAGGRPMA